MLEKIVLFTGSDKDFEQLLDERIAPDERTIEFLETIRLYNARIRASDALAPGFDPSKLEEVDNCIVRSNDFGSILSHVVSNFSSIVTQAHDIRTLYVQNPPLRSIASLESQYPQTIEREYTQYRSVSKNDLPEIYASLEEGVLGQEACKKEIVSSLYKLSVIQHERPIVLLLYGPSGVGKTETAKCLSESLGGKLTRIQMSMMQTSEAFEYIFGAEHSKGSFARDLLCRESNVVLLDEFDKVPAGLYNAFYELFDEGVFTDTNYQVDIKGGVFVCTSNFMNEGEIKKALGPAMYSRINACISFSDLRVEDKIALVNRHYAHITGFLDSDDEQFIEQTDILRWFTKNALRYNNMRIMKTKLERAIFGKLSERILASE